MSDLEQENLESLHSGGADQWPDGDIRAVIEELIRRRAAHAVIERELEQLVVFACGVRNREQNPRTCDAIDRLAIAVRNANG